MNDKELRYSFGRNWKGFVDRHFNPQRVRQARERLLASLRLPDLDGKTFLDIGSGSGLHSLAAMEAGAKQVVSFDYDPDSVHSTMSLRTKCGSPDHWQVLQGSVLDTDFMRELPEADIVYSWGVLHHTGDMWQAIRNARIPLKDDGVFFIALYSHTSYSDRILDGHPSPEQWLDIKRRYNRASEPQRRLMETHHFWRAWLRPPAGKPWKLFSNLRRFLETLRSYDRNRGMEIWTDIRDWLGGWPMEFIRERELIEGCGELGLEMLDVITGEGNTEFLLRPKGATNYWDAILARRRELMLAPPFEHVGGHAYTTRLDDLTHKADSTQAPRHSSLRLYEDGVLLPYAHAMHATIDKLGGGRYSHWNHLLYFSATDNSDPNASGRTYTIRYDPE